jgi:hypothetical protein
MKQTPYSYVTIMEGRARAAKREIELGQMQAYLSVWFERQKRLKPLKHYLSGSGGNMARKPKDMLAVLRELRDRGAPMKIRKTQLN